MKGTSGPYGVKRNEVGMSSRTAKNYTALRLVAFGSKESRHLLYATFAQAANSIAPIKLASKEERRQLNRLPNPTQKESLRIQQIQRDLEALHRKDFHVAPKLVRSRSKKTQTMTKNQLYGSVKHANNKRKSNPIFTFVEDQTMSAPSKIKQVVLRPSEARMSSASSPLSRRQLNGAHLGLKLHSSLFKIKALRLKSLSTVHKKTVEMSISRSNFSCANINLKTDLIKKIFPRQFLRRYLNMWKLTANSLTRVHLYSAGTVLRQTLSGLLARSEFQKRSTLQRMQFGRGKHCVAQFIQLREGAVVVLQAVMRGTITRILMLQRACAATATCALQCLTRSQAAKRALRRLGSESAQRSTAAVECQRRVRGQGARCRALTARAAIRTAATISLKRKTAARTYSCAGIALRRNA
mmetsp:Transcript_26081/g.78585  ORF Transcript_26081/g.78585 Transcript_26081/m.78585 type:complete len:411 (+) Transcript_26081:110-1342(+)